MSVLECLRQVTYLPHRLASLQASRESLFSIFLASQQVLEYYIGIGFASCGLELSFPHLHKMCFTHWAGVPSSGYEIFALKTEPLLNQPHLLEFSWTCEQRRAPGTAGRERSSLWHYLVQCKKKWFLFKVGSQHEWCNVLISGAATNIPGMWLQSTGDNG